MAGKQRFHVGPNGPGPCSAKPGNCPFGGDESHYGTLKEADSAFQVSMAKTEGVIPGIQGGAKFQVNRIFDAFARTADKLNNSLLDNKEIRLLTKKEKIELQLKAIRKRREAEGDTRVLGATSTPPKFSIAREERQEAKVEEVLTDIQSDYNSLNDQYSSSLTNLEDSHGFDYNRVAADLADEANRLRKEGKELEYRRGLIDIPEIDRGDYELNPDTSSINEEAYYQSLEDASMADEWSRELVNQVNYDVKQIQKVDWTQHGFDSQEAGVDEAIGNLSDYYDY